MLHHLPCTYIRPHTYSTPHQKSIYIYSFVELSSFVWKLLLQRVCDGRETWPCYSASHRECHKGVGGRRFIASEKCAAQIPTLMKIDAIFFVCLRMANARFRTRC